MNRDLLIYRQLDGERGALSFDTLHINLAMMFGYNLVCYWQAQSGSAVFGGKEWIENLLQFLRGYPLARILENDQDFAVC